MASDFHSSDKQVLMVTICQSANLVIAVNICHIEIQSRLASIYNQETGNIDTYHKVSINLMSLVEVYQTSNYAYMKCSYNASKVNAVWTSLMTTMVLNMFDRVCIITAIT